MEITIHLDRDQAIELASDLGELLAEIVEGKYKPKTPSWSSLPKALRKAANNGDSTHYGTEIPVKVTNV